MKYILSLTTCLALSYSPYIVSSAPDNTFTLYDHTDLDGKTRTISMDQGSRILFDAHPKMMTGIMKKIEEEIAKDVEKKSNNQTSENSASNHRTNPTREELRAQAINAYGAYNCRGTNPPKPSHETNQQKQKKRG